jgi:serine/threonine-protein kinase
LVIGIGAGLVVALIAVVAVILLGRSSTSAEAAKTQSASTSSSAASSQGASSAPAQASTAPGTSTTTTTVTAPARPSYPPVAITGTACGISGSSPYSHAAAGNDHTSCPFAQAVRSAYLTSGANGSDVTVEAYSKVTKLWYVMTCTGSQPVRCTGGNDALVWLYGGDATFS